MPMQRNAATALTQLRAYWEALRDGGPPPMRSAVDPRGIAGALEHAFVVERVAPGVARFRVAGMHLCDLMGMEVRGMPLSALLEPEDRAVLSAGLEQVFSAPAVFEARLESPRSMGRPALEAQVLILPLRDWRGQPNVAMGGIVASGEIGRAPRRFSIAHRIVARCLVAERHPAALAARHHPALAEAAAAFTPARPAPVPDRPVAGRPHLRLVKSD